VNELRPTVAVVVFPGSNDHGDAGLALDGLGAESVLVWHGEPELPAVSAAAATRAIAVRENDLMPV